MSQIDMSSTYESNYMSSTYESNWYEQYIWVKLLWVVHMSQITMGSTYESNYYG